VKDTTATQIADGDLVLSEPRQKKLAAFVNAHGVPKARELVPVAAGSLMRLVAGLRVRRGTLALAEPAIDALPSPSDEVLRAERIRSAAERTPAARAELVAKIQRCAAENLNAKQRAAFERSFADHLEKP
jgi:hypothetical protein